MYHVSAIYSRLVVRAYTFLCKHNESLFVVSFASNDVACVKVSRCLFALQIKVRLR